MKVITSITTILHDHAIVVDVQNGEFWKLEWIDMDRRTRVITSTSNVCRLRLLVLHQALNAITPAPGSYMPHSSRTSGYASAQLFSKTFKGRISPSSSVVHWLAKGVLARNTSTADWWRGENRDGYATVNGRYFPQDILTTRQEAHV